MLVKTLAAAPLLRTFGLAKLCFFCTINVNESNTLRIQEYVCQLEEDVHRITLNVCIIARSL